MSETFVTLVPPLFDTFGTPATIETAITEGLWIATANLWVVQTKPTPAIVYQQRSLSRKWAPGKLDVLVGGKIDAGEKPVDALLREAKEEMNLTIDESSIHFIGKNLHVGIIGDAYLHTVPHIFLSTDNRDLKDYKLQKEEVAGIFSLPINVLVDLHNKKIDSFETKGLDAEGNGINLIVTRESFPENWDNYHHKIAVLIQRYLKGEQVLY